MHIRAVAVDNTPAGGGGKEGLVRHAGLDGFGEGVVDLEDGGLCAVVGGD